jgi:hypothetical protein
MDLWVHYQERTDTLVAMRPLPLLTFLKEHCGQSGIWLKRGMGDGEYATGYIAPVSVIAAQPWVRTFTHFSGTHLTGEATFRF